MWFWCETCNKKYHPSGCGKRRYVNGKCYCKYCQKDTEECKNCMECCYKTDKNRDKSRDGCRSCIQLYKKKSKDVCYECAADIIRTDEYIYKFLLWKLNISDDKVEEYVGSYVSDKLEAVMDAYFLDREKIIDEIEYRISRNDKGLYSIFEDYPYRLSV